MISLRVVFFGTPQFAVPTLERLLASRHPVVGVVTQPDRARGRGHKVSDSPVKTVAIRHGIPLVQPVTLRDPAMIATLQSWRPDLGVVAAYGKIIPKAVLELPRLGMINVHASLLPKYRGAAPVQRAVIDGERETGVTIMRVEEMLDSGPMFAKATRPIDPDDTSDVIERDLAELGGLLLGSVVDRMAEGNAPSEPQDAVASSYAPKITREEGLIDWTLPAIDIHNRVRGLFPWPHAYTFLNGRRLLVLKTRVLGDERTGEAPGTVLDASPTGIHVAAGGGSQLAILELHPEGRRPMSARDFLAGHLVRPGVRLTGR